MTTTLHRSNSKIATYIFNINTRNSLQDVGRILPYFPEVVALPGFAWYLNLPLVSKLEVCQELFLSKPQEFHY